MVANGTAYFCYATQAELDEMRAAAQAEGRPMRYDGRWRDRDPATAPPGIKPVVRLRSPAHRRDICRRSGSGKVTWKQQEMDDLVLLRSDGTPTYMLAVVVDDTIWE